MIKKEQVSDPANPAAPPVEVTKILTPEALAKENAGALDMAPNGEVFGKAKLDSACFVFDTHVHTSLGLIKIGEIEPGMKVLSRSEATGEIGYRRVVNRFEHRLRTVFDLVYMNENGEAEMVATTLEHPFWVIGKGWVPASELQIGQELEICDPDGGKDLSDRPGGLEGVLAQKLRGVRSTAKVYSLEPPSERGFLVYNLEVEDFHTYFVGRMGVWVHNCDLSEITSSSVDTVIRLFMAVDSDNSICGAGNGQNFSLPRAMTINPRLP